MTGWELFYLLLGLFLGGTIGVFAICLVSAGNRSARDVAWVPDE